MPSNIFATTGTNVSIIFIDKTNKTGKAVLVDASSLGTKIKDGKSQKTLLSDEDDQKIIDAVNNAEAIDGFSVVKTFEDIRENGGYSFNPGTYFDVQIEYLPITVDEFEFKMREFTERLSEMFNKSNELGKIIQSGIRGLKLE
jgi:type I restriction enzyme M protein